MEYDNTDIKAMEERLIELEVKFSHQDELLSELNILVSKQEVMIEGLALELKKYSEQGATKGLTIDTLKDEVPPHY